MITEIDYGYDENRLAKYLEEQGHSVLVENILSLSKEEFAKARHIGFGASDSSKLLEVNPFCTKEELLTEKVEMKHDEAISKKASVRKGAELENIILDKGLKLLQELELDNTYSCFKPVNMYGNLDNHLTTNFDGVIMKDNTVYSVLEAKLVTKYGTKYYKLGKALLHTENGDLCTKNAEIEKATLPIINDSNIQNVCETLADLYGVPVYYFTQVQQQLYFINKPEGYLVVQTDENWDTYVFKIHYYPEIVEQLKKVSKKSWALVEARRKITQKLKP